MSVRAYRANIELYGERFNLWHDRLFIDLLDSMGLLYSLNGDLCGIIEIADCHVRKIESLLSDPQSRRGFIESYGEEEVVKTEYILSDVKKDIEESQFGYATYYCF